MQVFRGIQHAALAPACALTIGNFDGVHRGHQAMLALAAQRSASPWSAQHSVDVRASSARLLCGPHGQAELAPSRVATFARQVVRAGKLRRGSGGGAAFDKALASLTPDEFVDRILVQGLKAQYVLVGDDFRFGAKRAGDYALLDAMGSAKGFDVARMNSYEVHGERVSSSLVREALERGDMKAVATMLGGALYRQRPRCARSKLGRSLDCRTLNVRFGHPKPATMGIFVVRTHGLADHPLEGVASLGVRPTVEEAGRVLLEVHCFDWPARPGSEGATVKSSVWNCCTNSRRSPLRRAGGTAGGHTQRHRRCARVL